MFEKYQTRIESEIRNVVDQMGEKTRLRDACEYALKSGGKRMRPLFALMIAEALGGGLDVMPVALSVEFFHTASLIADDLPCMDNDDERRGRASLHRVFEESVALLASYTFIAMGYEGIYKNNLLMKQSPVFAHLADRALNQGLGVATRLAGIFGATNGQFLDLFPPDRSLETIQKIIVQKTVTLFQISFALGWLFGGGDFSRLKEVEQAAFHLGLAFQIADDLNDASQDASHHGEVNITTILGWNASMDLFCQEVEKLEKALKTLGLWNQEFEKAVGFLQSLAPTA